MDLAASNTSLRKANAKLSAERKEFSSKLIELKSKNEELEENYVELVQAIAKLIGEIDTVKDELAKERAENSGLKKGLETVRLKAQSVAMDAVLSARAELIKEYKKGEHASWDPDEEIETWKKRKTVLAAGEEASDEEEDEEESALVVGSPKLVEVCGGSRHAEPNMGEPGVDDQAVGAGDVEEQGQVEPVASRCDFTRD